MSASSYLTYSFDRVPLPEKDILIPVPHIVKFNPAKWDGGKQLGGRVMEQR